MKPGTIVTLNGNLYKGQAIVLAYWEKRAPGEKVLPDKPGEPYPQVALRTKGGMDIHYNGDDIAEGKIVATRARPADESEYKHYSKGDTGVNFSERGLSACIW